MSDSTTGLYVTLSPKKSRCKKKLVMKRQKTLLNRSGMLTWLAMKNNNKNLMGVSLGVKTKKLMWKKQAKRKMKNIEKQPERPVVKYGA